MGFDKTKVTNITNELINFYFKIGIMDIDIALRDRGKETKVTLEGECSDPPCSEKLEEIKEVLNIPRQAELEDYYSELVGDYPDYPELSLLGAMVDRASIDLDKNKLKIAVYRKK